MPGKGEDWEDVDIKLSGPYLQTDFSLKMISHEGLNVNKLSLNIAKINLILNTV